MKTPPTISLPQGVRDILPEETERIERVTSRVIEVFRRRGFRKVITPLLEYVDVLSLGVGNNLRDRVFKFIDPSTGRVVAIRPDITPQIARVVASRMRDYERPLKLFYDESVLRYQEAGDGKSRVVLQIGAEYITERSSPETDAEMITMAMETLEATGLKDFKVDIGDVGFLKAILSGLELTQDEVSLIRESIAKKDTAGLSSILDSLEKPVGGGKKELLTSLTTLYGEEEVLEKARRLAAGEKASGVLANLKKVFDLISEKGYKGRVTFDLGEVRGFDYYTGIIFEGFASGVGKAILSGGRYDNLLGKYGYDSAATGFAIDVENIVTALEETGG